MNIEDTPDLGGGWRGRWILALSFQLYRCSRFGARAQTRLKYWQLKLLLYCDQNVRKLQLCMFTVYNNQIELQNILSCDCLVQAQAPNLEHFIGFYHSDYVQMYLVRGWCCGSTPSGVALKLIRNLSIHLYQILSSRGGLVGRASASQEVSSANGGLNLARDYHRL